MTDAAERLVNLAFFLADAKSPVTAERIRTEVRGYSADQDDAAFIRMFERDKDDLKRAGFTIEATPEGNYTLDASASFASEVELTPEEAAAVRTAGAALLDDPTFPFAADLRLALTKISAEVDAAEAPSAARLADEDPQRQGAAVTLLSGAATARKRVSFGYTNSLGESGPHEVEPYGLFIHDGRWYLVGRDTAKDEARTYNVTRMEDVKVNPAAPKTPDFERPAGFDVGDFIRLPFQYGPDDAEFEATLRFDESAAWRARSLAGSQGALEREADGMLTWRVPARSGRRLIRFVIENGPGITVLAPAELVETMRAGLERAEAIHG